MANALTDFTKKREFLICMDSDGCVMDTVRIKHSTVMCPELIRVFALDDQAAISSLPGISMPRFFNRSNTSRTLSNREMPRVIVCRLISSHAAVMKSA